MSLIQTCTPNGHLYRVTYTRCRIDTINSPDDGHMAARNMYRIEINVDDKELCVMLVSYKDYTEMHDQRNIKLDPYPVNVNDITGTERDVQVFSLNKLYSIKISSLVLKYFVIRFMLIIYCIAAVQHECESNN